MDQEELKILTAFKRRVAKASANNIENNKKLIVEFQQGSQERFNEIYNTYRFQLYQFVHNLILNRPEAEDITADCFIKLWNKKNHINNIKAFLFVTAHNACIDYLRHEQVIHKSQKELAFLLENNEDFVLTKMIEAEILRQLYAGIESLPPQCRKIFEMLYFQGLDYEKVANELKLDQSTVRHQKRIALKLLRNIIFQNKAFISIMIILI